MCDGEVDGSPVEKFVSYGAFCAWPAPVVGPAWTKFPRAMQYFPAFTVSILGLQSGAMKRSYCRHLRPPGRHPTLQCGWYRPPAFHQGECDETQNFAPHRNCGSIRICLRAHSRGAETCNPINGALDAVYYAVAECTHSVADDAEYESGQSKHNRNPEFTDIDPEHCAAEQSQLDAESGPATDERSESEHRDPVYHGNAERAGYDGHAKC